MFKLLIHINHMFCFAILVKNFYYIFMEIKKINLKNKLSKFNDLWSPKIISMMNDYQFKLAKIKGNFIWHDHNSTDETFIVIKGEMIMKLENGDILVKEGEMIVIPKGTKHKPTANEECHILVVEPKGIINTGDEVNKLTINNEIWI